MRRWLAVSLALALLASTGGWAVGASEKRRKPTRDELQMYTAILQPDEIADLAAAGYDVITQRDVSGGIRVDLVLSSAQRARLEARGVRLETWRNSEGLTVAEVDARQKERGYKVWRSFDESGGIKDELYRIAQNHPEIVKLEVIGRSIRGREIIALKVTENANAVADGRRPASLYISAQHAREWISVEVNRRLLHYFVRNYSTSERIRDLLSTRELWFVIVSNPDGYEYTFDKDRLWRKNLRDNDGDGEITADDGVDLNRNFPEHWKYDEEGSSSNFSSETYRGAAPASEPETEAMKGLLDRIGFELMINYHSFGRLILYPFGWQEQTPATDNPIFAALSGTDKRPAIKGYNPGVGADLYITNGETTDYAYAEADTLAWTVELSQGRPGNGFVFPDNRELVRREFRINRPFALDVAKSATHPENPTSHLGNETKPFYLDRFKHSYGDPQTVQVTAARSLGDVTLNYSINEGPAQSAPTTEWNGGERFGGNDDVYYRKVRGSVAGTEPGDTVEVWFTGGGFTSPSFTYKAAVESNADVLILSAEDYTGSVPRYKNSNGPRYLAQYRRALKDSGYQSDVYDVDARGRRAPDHLGVLSHYGAVVWYTGDDIITREPGMGSGTASRLANEEKLQVRAYLNEGGKLLFTGKYAGLQYAANLYQYDPGQFLLDDFLQYYLGAYVYSDNTGTKRNGALYDAVGEDRPFGGLAWSFGEPSANNQDHSAAFLTTSAALPPDEFPQFRSWSSVDYEQPNRPFEPHSGNYFVYSQIGDISYKRLTKTIDLSGASSGKLSFWISRNTEPGWDFVFVEAHRLGRNDWTTLRDLNGHTSTDPGISCLAGWHQIHPFLRHYQTRKSSRECLAHGTTGKWNAASGASNGWEKWKVNLSRWAGQKVEVSISYVSDWAVQGVGVFVDDIAVSTGESTSFEDGLSGWRARGRRGSAANPNDYVRTTAADIPAGAAATTEDSIYFGFGLEGIAGRDARARVMGRAMEYLLRGPR
jgi:hypothetical protein